MSDMYPNVSDKNTDGAARYSRQTRLNGWGNAGQRKLAQARVLVVGAGGLGCPALQYLAAAGVGNIRIADADVVSADNLQRQVLYGEADIGQPKAVRAAERLRALNSAIRTESRVERFEAENAALLLSEVDLVLDCSDNLATRFLVHDMCYAQGVALVQAAVYIWEGQVLVFRFDQSRSQGCWRCLWDEAPDDSCVDSCAEVGIAGTVTGTLGAIQANTALRILLGMPAPGTGLLTTVDLQTLETSRLKWTSRPACPLCGGAHAHESHTDTRNAGAPLTQTAGDQVFDWVPERGPDGKIDTPFFVIDIREQREISAADYELFDRPGMVLHLPLSGLAGLEVPGIKERIAAAIAGRNRGSVTGRQAGHAAGTATINEAVNNTDPGTVLILCAMGFRSGQFVRRLRGVWGESDRDDSGGMSYFSVAGGLQGIRNGGRQVQRL